jgi:hypothetical protein
LWQKLPLDLTAQDDQLLAKQRIFCDEVDPGASEIGERFSPWRAIGWLGPLNSALVQTTGASCQRYVWQGGIRNASRNACQTVREYC